MPHSSGGGSHGGGSHGGSHSSSHGGSGGSSRRVKNTYFPGASRYVYYKNSKPMYVYANYDITEKRSKLRYLMLIFYIPFIAIIVSMIASSFHHPQKMRMDYDTDIVIEDRIGVIDDEDGLNDSLRAFQDATGITPAVITVYNEDWYSNYSSLENYAFDLYVNAFTDEKHWLIVYSQPKEIDGDFVNWYWEGMQGDDTDPIITEEAAAKFNDMLQRKLLTVGKSNVGDAIGECFVSASRSIMEPYMVWSSLFMGLGVGAFIVFHMFFMVFYTPNNKKEYREATKCPEYVQEETCEYCDGVYVVGTCLSCPHCGAPVKAHSYYRTEDGNAF